MVMNDRIPLNIKQTELNNDLFKVYHQNVRSLRNKTQELLSHLHSNLLHVICLSEHHLIIQELCYANLECYTIGAQFCRPIYQRGGVIIYVHNGIQFTNIDLSDYCIEKSIEICVVKINIKSFTMCIITLYRAPSGNFTHFLQRLDNVLKFLHTQSTRLVICGDLNINYLVDNALKRQLDNLLCII